LFADHYDLHPRGLPSDHWSCDDSSSYEFAGEPVKGGRLSCLNAKYGDKVLVEHPNARSEIVFTVESGRRRLWLLFAVGGSPYESGKLMEDGGDGTEQGLHGMSADYPVVDIAITGKP